MELSTEFRDFNNSITIKFIFTTSLLTTESSIDINKISEENVGDFIWMVKNIIQDIQEDDYLENSRLFNDDIVMGYICNESGKYFTLQIGDIKNRLKGLNNVKMEITNLDDFIFVMRNVLGYIKTLGVKYKLKRQLLFSNQEIYVDKDLHFSEGGSAETFSFKFSVDDSFRIKNSEGKYLHLNDRDYLSNNSLTEIEDRTYFFSFKGDFKNAKKFRIVNDKFRNFIVFGKFALEYSEDFVILVGKKFNMNKNQEINLY